jgi:hypothetical protein
MKKLLPIILCFSGLTLFFACQKSHDVMADHPASERRSTAAGEVGMESVLSDCGQFRTQTQGGWGAGPAGGNPGTYLHAHFASAYPSGLTVGCESGGFSVHYSSAGAITEFLPAGGSPSVLTANANDPFAKSIKNVLIGQVTALALSVGFDYADPEFGQAEENLGNMIIASGPFAGKSISEFLAIANSFLGGCATGYTASEINQAATLLNENFDDGNTDGGFVVCPGPRFER